MSIVLPQKFFDRDPVTVAQELLGNFLVIKDKKYIITEVEAYGGEDDDASHAIKGKTERNTAMFSHPGCRYVYMVYGMYYMLNIITKYGAHPSAVFIRAVKEFPGPGKLTKELGIDKKFNGEIAHEKTGLRIEESRVKIPKIQTSPRIGINYASEEWKNKHWRFFI